LLPGQRSARDKGCNEWMIDWNDGRVGTKIESCITMVRNKVETCLHCTTWCVCVCVAHICTEITFSLQLRSIKPPQPAEPRKLMCFCYPVSPAPCLFSFSPVEQIHLCGICPHQRNQAKQTRVIKVYCSINKSSRAPLASLKLRVFDDEKQLSVLTSEKWAIWKHHGNLFGTFERENVSFSLLHSQSQTLPNI